MKKLLIILFLFPTFCSCQKLVTVSVKRLSRETARLPNRIAVFGDSFSTNTGVSYPWIVNTDYGIPWTQYAVGGTAVCTNTYAPVGGNNNLIDKYQTEINLGYSGQLVSFAFGQNDAAVLGGTPGAQWKATYQAIIQAFIDAGFPRRRLMIMAEPNHSTQAASHANVRAYILQISKELGILYYDVYQRFLDTGLNDTYYTAGDGFVHPNAAGQLIWTAGYETFLVR